MAKIKTTVKVTGGRNLEQFLRTAGKGGVSGVRVGFFSTARYDDDDGTPVATVAAVNEFGSRQANIPERPFFRQAIAKMEDGVPAIIRGRIDPQRMVIDDRLANQVGAYAAGQVRERITDLREPSNSPATIEAKGSDNPLIDTGFMRQSATWEVER